MRKIFLLGLFVAAVAAAPKHLKSKDDSLSPLPQIVPESEIPAPEVADLPEPELPVIAPEPIELPEPELPVIVPEPIVLPEPELPVIVPEPIVLPQPELPVVAPEPIVLPEPQLPVIAPEPIVLPEPVLPEVQLPIPLPVPIEEEFQPQPQIPNGEIFNDGIVQVTVNAPEEGGVFSSIHSWISMVLNYISNGIQSSHQIIG